MSINEEINLDNINIDATISTGIDVSSVGVGGPRGEKGDKGDKGDTGNTGPANTLSIGTVTGGDIAEATITGSAPNQTLNLVLPKGDKGDKGEKGDTGHQGDTGAQGPKGDKGDTGADGANGVSPTVTTSKSGKVTTITITDVNGVHTATVNDGADGSGTGDMLKATYDTDGNGIVDNAEKVNNHTVGTDVPANAVFTDTTYSNFSGATSSVAGSAGLVPAPTTSDPGKFLKGDGTWATPPGTTYTAGTNVQISNQNVISATDTTYTAGTGISISNNVISATGGGGGGVSLTMSTTDIGEGAQLAANTLYGVYE